jgi:hypothetical protein
LLAFHMLKCSLFPTCSLLIINIQALKLMLLEITISWNSKLYYHLNFNALSFCPFVAMVS